MSQQTNPAIGLVLRAKTPNGQILERITHVFSANIYLMRIGGPSDYRDARRPYRKSLVSVVSSLKKRELQIGQIPLPPDLSTEPKEKSEEETVQNEVWAAIAPLLSEFNRESNLARTSFQAKLEQHAEKIGWSATTLRRMLFKYWYYGSVKTALQERRKGPAPFLGSAAAGRRAEDDAGRRRPGAKSRLEKTRGPNEFKRTGADVEDMLAALRRVAEGASKGSREPGSATIKAAHIEWLHNDFAARHASIYRRWNRGRHVMPLSYTQYYRLIKANADLDDTLFHCFATLSEDRSPNSLSSSGPGEVYEIDPTGGQIVLLPAFYGDSSWRSYRPSIYIVIDRWSRRIMGVYVSLRPCSWEVLRMVLRTSFTSRKRFEALGMSITDKEWAPGPPPAKIYMDRGPEMIGQQMLDAAVDGLRITGRILPPLTPDGKAIVEKVIGDLKRAMKRNARLQGQYKKFRTSPKDEATKKQAAQVAVATLFDLYRALLAIALDHNKRPHSALKRMSVLKLNGIAPTPNAAYEFGIKHITAAARRFPRSKRDLDVKVDPTLRAELVVPAKSHPWPKWRVDKAGAADLQQITFEEEAMLVGEFQRRTAEADDLYIRSKAPAKASKPPKAVDQLHRRLESDRLKNAVSGIDMPPPMRRQPAQRYEPTHSLMRAIDELEEFEHAKVVEANQRRSASR